MCDSTLDEYSEDRVEQYGGLSRMVNRNNETVSAGFVCGRAVFADGSLTDIVGIERTGRFLRAAADIPWETRDDMELASVR